MTGKQPVNFDVSIYLPQKVWQIYEKLKMQPGYIATNVKDFQNDTCMDAPKRIKDSCRITLKEDRHSKMSGLFTFSLCRNPYQRVYFSVYLGTRLSLRTEHMHV